MTRGKRSVGGINVEKDKQGVGWQRSVVGQMNDKSVLQGLADPGGGVMLAVLSFAQGHGADVLREKGR